MDKSINSLKHTYNDTNIELENEIKLNTFQVNNKNSCINSNEVLFLYNEESVLSLKDIDFLSDRLKINRLPDIFYGYNRVYIIFPNAYNLILEINPLHAIDSLDFKGNNYFNSSMLNKLSSIYQGDVGSLNDHYLYKQHIKDISRYSFLSNYKEYGNISFKIEETKDKIPVEKLSPENTILKYIQIPLFFDDFNLIGFAYASFKLRIMKDCFYGLLRFYIRADKEIKLLETRYFHNFEDMYILKNYTLKEVTYDELKQKGYDINRLQVISINEVSAVSFLMNLIQDRNEKILFMNK